MIIAILIALLVTAGAIPVQAGVYAIEQKDGSWRVSKYDDDDPTVRVTQFDRNKTIRLDKKVQKLDDSLKQYTLAGEARLAAYFNTDQEWLKQQSRNRLGRSEAKHFLAECVNDVCLPEPGSKGRPPYPSMEEGRDFTYKKVQMGDDSLKQYTLTLAGEARLAAYFDSDREWLKRNKMGIPGAKHFLGECINNVCLPEPGTEGRPPYPSMEEGRDFTYGFKTVTVKVDAPNPDYLKYIQPWYIVSDRAKRPGGRWLIGTTVEMTNQEFNDYLLYLESATP